MCSSLSFPRWDRRVVTISYLRKLEEGRESSFAVTGAEKIKWNPSVLNTLVIHISMSKNTQKLLKMKSLKWKWCQPHSSIDKAPALAFSYLIHHQRKESLSPGMDLTAQTSIGKKMFLSPTAVSQPNKVNAPWDGRSKINRAVTLHVGSCCPENVPK